MKKSVLIILFTSFLPGIPRLKKLNQKYRLKLQETHGISLHFGKCRLRSLTHIRIDDVQATASHPVLNVNIKSLDCTLSFRLLCRLIAALVTPIHGGPFRLSLRLNACRLGCSAISSRPVTIDGFDLDIFFQLGRHSFLVGEGSGGRFNRIPFTFNIDYRDQEPDLAIISLRIADISLADILGSFPDFLYRNIYSVRAEGLLSLHVLLKYHFRFPARHQLTFRLDNEGFAAKHPCAADLAYLNDPFCHRVYDNGRYIRDIFLSTENPEYTPCDTLPAHLLDAIICTEDPAFWTHNGVDQLLFRNALMLNMMAMNYTHGGSTITMQLVRNLFLNHQKDLYRKMEEILLSWLMEEVSRLPKRRILEIYVNIIEWGPGVYGISAASELYFSKSPPQLTLTEGLVLTYIIPRPKYFIEAVKTSSPRLLTNLKKHIDHYSMVMRRRGFITEEEAGGLNDTIEFANGLGTISFQ